MEVAELLSALEQRGMKGVDISDDELAKTHGRYMIGGVQQVPNERLFRFGTCCNVLLFCHGLMKHHVKNSLNDPELSGNSCLVYTLGGMSRCSTTEITAQVRSSSIVIRSRLKTLSVPLDLGKVLAGIQVPPNDADEFNAFLEKLGYPFVEETDNEVYKRYLRG